MPINTMEATAPMAVQLMLVVLGTSAAWALCPVCWLYPRFNQSTAPGLPVIKLLEARSGATEPLAEGPLGAYPVPGSERTGLGGAKLLGVTATPPGGVPIDVGAPAGCWAKTTPEVGAMLSYHVWA